MAANTKGLLSFDQNLTSTVSRTLEFYTDISQVPSGTYVGQTQVDFFVNLNDAAVPQVNTVTIASPVAAADSYYTVKITGVSTTNTFAFLSLAADVNSVTTIASNLATLINTHPEVVATSVSGIITITGVVPGAAFTVNVDCRVKSTDAQDSGKISTASVTVASGTAKSRKMFTAYINLSVVSNQPRFDAAVTAYDGAVSPTIVGAVRNVSSISSRTMTQYLETI